MYSKIIRFYILIAALSIFVSTTHSEPVNPQIARQAEHFGLLPGRNGPTRYSSTNKNDEGTNAGGGYAGPEEGLEEGGLIAH